MENEIGASQQEAEYNEDRATLERVFEGVEKVLADLCALSEKQQKKESVKLVRDKASELLVPLIELKKEESITAIAETKQSSNQQQQQSSTSNSPCSSQNSMDMSTTSSSAMPSQPSDEAPVLLQPVLTTMDEPMQKHKKEQALSLEREALSQPVQHKAKATT